MSATKTILDSKQAKTVVSGILESFASLGRPNGNDFSKLNQFFSQHVEMISNDHHITNTLEQFQQRIRSFQQRFPHITYSKLLEEPLISGNKIVLRYNADATDKTGKKAQFIIIAIVTIEDEKVVRWVEVIHEKGTGHIDK